MGCGWRWAEKCERTKLCGISVLSRWDVEGISMAGSPRVDAHHPLYIHHTVKSAIAHIYNQHIDTLRA